MVLMLACSRSVPVTAPADLPAPAPAERPTKVDEGLPAQPVLAPRAGAVPEAYLSCAQPADCAAVSVGCCGPFLAVNKGSARVVSEGVDFSICAVASCARPEHPPVTCASERCVLDVRMHDPDVLRAEDRFRACAADAECYAAPVSCCRGAWEPVNALGRANWDAHVNRDNCSNKRCAEPSVPPAASCQAGLCTF